MIQKMWKIKDLHDQKITYISNEVATIGRNINANIVSYQKHVSRIHAKLFKKERSLFLKDNNTSNGTFVNNKKIPKDTEYLLKEGDIISLGTGITYRVNGNISRVVKYEVQREDANVSENIENIENFLNEPSEEAELLIPNGTNSINEDDKINKNPLNNNFKKSSKQSTSGEEFKEIPEVDITSDEEVFPSSNDNKNLENKKEDFKEPQLSKANQNGSKLFDESDIIILSDDDDDDNFSCSQLLNIDLKKENDLDDSLYPYKEIKEELSALDEIEENILNKVPIDLEDDFSSTCDLINCLESPNPKVNNKKLEELDISCIPSTSAEEIFEKQKYPNNVDETEKQKAAKFQKFNKHLLNETPYSTPPVVEAHHLPSKRNKLSTSPKTGVKRTHEEEKPETPKKQKTRRSRKSKSPVPKKLTKEEKKLHDQVVKERIKQLATPTNNEPTGARVTTRRPSVGTAKVKVSESRGNFLLESGPPVPAKRDSRERAKLSKDIKIPFKELNIVPGVVQRPVQNNFRSRVDIQDVFDMVVKWNVSWLNDSNITPPVNPHAPVKMLRSFNSFNEYNNIISPLMYLETWEFISQTFHKENLETIKVIKLSHRFIGQSLHIDCKCYLEKKQRADIIKNDDYALIEYSYTDPKTKQKILQINFGLIQNLVWKTIDKNDGSCFDTSLVGLDSPHTKLSFTIMTRNVESRYPMAKTFLVKSIANLKITFKMFKTLRLLEKSPICRLVLKPAIEDFTFPLYNNPLICEGMLNPQQKHIVKEATYLCLGNTAGLYLVQGPPGTGKSRLIVNLLFQILMSDPKKNPLVLLTAPSNNAVDNLLIKIQEFRSQLTDEQRKALRVIRVGPEASIGKQVSKYKLSFFTKKEMFLKSNENARNLVMSEKDRDEYLKKHYGHHYNYVFKTTETDVINGCNVICTTLNSCLHNQIMEAMNRKQVKFTCCIVDEASQCSELECLAPTQLGIDKFVLVGDPKQLPALVNNPQASTLGYSKSLFQRILENFHRNTPVRMLRHQYRMHEEICRFPNNKFYDGKLISLPNFENKIKPAIKPYLVFAIKDQKENSLKTQSLYENEKEVAFVKELIRVLTSSQITSTCPYTIGVLTPYSAQKKRIIQALSEFKFASNITVNVNTVDSFQGQEQDIVIISCVRHSTNNFLQSTNRFNVALTRAKQALYVIGTYNLYKHNQLLYELREDAKVRKLLIDFQGISSKLADYLRKYIFM
ncbi:unnamed protein product [Brassicogethes aeneus]|uniref:FHA domain-containing protein n=1 Tax=Brassicogethes aeneus TaxID=1431903 RepID=A0A9P0ANU2_BRAAE|nr:unnamed protein product [Brassicogethes aeneus]